MAEKSGSGYFMAFDGDRGGEPEICFKRSEADTAEQADTGPKARSGPASKGKIAHRAVRPKQVRRTPKAAAESESKFAVAPHDESEESSLQTPPAGSLGRTKRLIMAALRVWELKQGIRE